MKLWKANQTFWMGEIDVFSPESDFSRIACGEVIGEFENCNRMLVKERQIPKGLMSYAEQYLTLIGTVADPPVC